MPVRTLVMRAVPEDMENSQGGKTVALSRRYLPILALILILLALGGMRELRNHLDYVRELEGFRRDQLSRWISEQRASAYRLDQALAEVLVAPDADSRGEALQRAQEVAYQGRETLWEPAPMGRLNQTLERWGYRKSYERAGDYLAYLGRQDSHGPLSPLEAENLELIRRHARLIHQAFTDLIPHIQSEELTPEGTRVIRKRPWARILADQSLLDVLDDAGKELNLLPPVGGEDSGYQEYLRGRREEWEPHQTLLDMAQRILGPEETLSVARAFVRELTGNTVTSVEESSFTGGTSVTGTGSHPDHESYTHILAVQVRGWEYEVEVTRAGGHISQVVLRGHQGVESLADLQKASMELLEGWGKTEDVNLEILNTQENSEAFGLAAAVVKNQVLCPHLVIHLRASLEPRGFQIALDAFSYLTGYFPPEEFLTPQLSPQEALDSIGSQLAALGEPRLQMRFGSHLVYAIPVTGVTGVDRVFIDAATGRHMGMEYRFPVDP